MKPLTILLTGTGAPGTPGTVYSLRNNPDGREVRIIGTDTDAGCLNQHLVDAFFAVPLVRGEGLAYRQSVATIADTEGVEVILPQTTAEARYYQTNCELRFFADIVYQSQTYRDVQDKWLLFQSTESMYIPRPNTTLFSGNLDQLNKACVALGYPEEFVVAKPTNSTGSRGVAIVCPRDTDFMRCKPGLSVLSPKELFHRLYGREILLQQHLPGPEYTVDCFRGEGGFIAIPRLRAKTRGGITTRAETIIHTEKGRQLAEWCRIMSDAFDLRYAHGYQWKESAKGTPRLLECNARIQGTMVTSTHAGFNMIWASVKEAMGEPACVPPMESLEDVVYERVWGGVATKREEVIA